MENLEKPAESKEERIAWLKKEIEQASLDTGNAEEGEFEPVYNREAIEKLKEELARLENS